MSQIDNLTFAILAVTDRQPSGFLKHWKANCLAATLINDPQIALNRERLHKYIHRALSIEGFNDSAIKLVVAKIERCFNPTLRDIATACMLNVARRELMSTQQLLNDKRIAAWVVWTGRRNRTTSDREFNRCRRILQRAGIKRV